MLNHGTVIASGEAPAKKVLFGDMDGDGRDDYPTLSPKTGALHAFEQRTYTVESSGGKRRMHMNQVVFIHPRLDSIDPLVLNKRRPSRRGPFGRLDCFIISSSGNRDFPELFPV